ncbi:hypothetical protein TrLO_g4191 [Triparma laevis f. longispina]|uniref:Uncharacterized protein n=1 Tax=Triparma laevis f. longispina TaxID=1714387 RepID=A0A9W7FJZ9_9STRA|nr:hypothetical protein TrLO_g4191 [Triparma laevis f. longispina]
MPPRPQKRRKGNEEEGANVAAIPQDDVKLEALVAVKQEPSDNPQENRVEEIQAGEPSSSVLLAVIQSMRNEMKEEMKGAKQEMNEKMESVFEEMISVKDELREARKEIAALK